MDEKSNQISSQLIFQQSSFIRFVNYYENGCENCEKGVSQFGTCNLSTSQHSFGFGNSRNLVN